MVLLLNHHQVSVEKNPVIWRHVILYPVKQEEVWRRAKGFRKPIPHILQDLNKELNPIHSIFFSTSLLTPFVFFTQGLETVAANLNNLPAALQIIGLISSGANY